MDATLAGLLHDCAGEPDDLALRLILADWLEDHGQPHRAAFVRLQCQFAAHIPDHQQRFELITEQDALLAQHRDTWLGGLAKHCEHIRFVAGLCRILVTSKKFVTKAFQKALAEVADRALIEQIHITRCQKLAKVLDAPGVAVLPGLSFARLGLNDAQLGEILACKQLEHLAALDLSNNALTEAGATALARSALLQRLTRLEIRNNPIDPAGLCSLLESTRSGKLREIDLSGVAFDRDVLTALLVWRTSRTANPHCVTNSLGSEFVQVPAGSFLMGSTPEEMDEVDRDNEGPQREVTLTQPFWFGRFAVTQAEYEAVVGNNPSNFPDLCSRPVESVNFFNAETFCQMLSNHPDELAAGRHYRLPTEAEWEYACRAGTFTPFYLGDRPTTDFVNYDGGHVYPDMAAGEYVGSPAPVGSYPPNAFGLYEMHGNVWEWTSDRYADSYPNAKPAKNPTGPKKGRRRAIRGGCWDAVCSYCRAAHRYGETASDRDYYTGFRIVMVQQ